MSRMLHVGWSSLSMTATDAPITPPPMMSASTSSGGGEPTTTPIWRRAPPRAGVSAAPRRLASAKLRERRPPPPRDLSTISARAAAGLTGPTSSRPGRGPSGGTSLSKTANVNSHAKKGFPDGCPRGLRPIFCVPPDAPSPPPNLRCAAGPVHLAARPCAAVPHAY